MPTDQYFGSGVDAERYLRARPRIHEAVVNQIRQALNEATPFARALDVGCGTGQSAVALTAVAESVVGIDQSTDMLAHAEPHARVSYRKGTAEAIPFEDERFELISAGLAFHWFDSDAFLAEAHRLLTRSGWLVVYNSGFTGHTREVAGVTAWFRDQFLKRYPTPPRNAGPMTTSFAQAHGFSLVREEPLSNEVEMTIDRFVDYELTTTNVMAAVQRGHSLGDVESWMHQSLAGVFQGHQSATFLFAGHIWYLQKRSA